MADQMEDTDTQGLAPKRWINNGCYSLVMEWDRDKAKGIKLKLSTT